jgi:hypothetical protein
VTDQETSIRPNTQHPPPGDGGLRSAQVGAALLGLDDGNIDEISEGSESDEPEEIEPARVDGRDTTKR